MQFQILRNDIAAMKADAIVNTANPMPVIGEGVDAAIHQRAGAELLAARKQIGKLSPGQCAITPAFGLDARYVIHTVGPRWKGGKKSEPEKLASCYRRSMEVAVENGIRAIAFPSIATGVYHFPLDLAAQIAVRTVRAFVREHPGALDLVEWLLLDEKTKEVYEQEIARAEATEIVNSSQFDEMNRMLREGMIF
jgi:O-acetyl-ADP-ribose deacetylase (regulator of RNase III)